MSNPATAESVETHFSSEEIRAQLENVVRDPMFRSSKRSVQFLRFVVEQTLEGAADQIKERTIGAEVFGRDPNYDTAADHVVRTAAIELRKRLAVYYNDERHKHELRMSLVPGSYVPRFSAPFEREDPQADPASSIARSPAAVRTDPPAAQMARSTENEPTSKRPQTTFSAHTGMYAAGVCLLLIVGFLAWLWIKPANAEDLFWKPVLGTPGSILLAVGDIPNGPPSASFDDKSQPIPVIQKGLRSDLPLADAITIARVQSALQSHGKKVIIRPEASRSFSDLKDSPVVLIGAFNNEWSVRITHPLRYSLALDNERHLIYIRDSHNPGDRSWSQVTAPTVEEQLARGGPIRQDYALVSRIWNAETGQTVFVIGGLYAYGTEAAGEFVTDPAMLEKVAHSLPLADVKRNIQMVLQTTITDDTPGLPKVLAVSAD